MSTSVDQQATKPSRSKIQRCGVRLLLSDSIAPENDVAFQWLPAPAQKRMDRPGEYRFFQIDLDCALESEVQGSGSRIRFEATPILSAITATNALRSTVPRHRPPQAPWISRCRNLTQCGVAADTGTTTPSGPSRHRRRLQVEFPGAAGVSAGLTLRIASTVSSSPPVFWRM